MQISIERRSLLAYRGARRGLQNALTFRIFAVSAASAVKRIPML
jgi:hypothetical protein